MYQIYIISFSLVWEQLTPPMLRQAIFLNWGTVLTKPLQRLYEIIFGVYANGSTDLAYDALTAYVATDKVVYTDRGVYECKVKIGNRKDIFPKKFIVKRGESFEYNGIYIKWDGRYLLQ